MYVWSRLAYCAFLSLLLSICCSITVAGVVMWYVVAAASMSLSFGWATWTLSTSVKSAAPRASRRRSS